MFKGNLFELSFCWMEGDSEMSGREQIIEKIKSLPDDLLKKVVDFIKSLEKTDPLEEVIGICEGPPYLAEKSDKYVYE